MLRSAVAILFGIIAGALIVALVEWAGQQAFPLPAGVDVNDRAQLVAVIEQAPLSALLMVLLAWFFGACDGAMIAAWLAPSRPWRHGSVVVLVLAMMAVVMLQRLPHPRWFVFATPPTYLLAWLIGSKIGSMLHDRRRAGIAR